MRWPGEGVGRLGRWPTIGACLALILVIGVDDYTRRTEALPALLYLLPIALGAWHIRGFGLALAALAAITSFLVDRPRTGLVDDAGQFVIFTAVAVLVRRAKELRDSSRATQAIMRAMSDAIPVRVFWKDKTLAFLGGNASFAHDAGFADPAQLVGKDDYHMAWREQAEQLCANDLQVIERNAPKLLVEEARSTADRKVGRFLTSRVPLHGPRDEVVGVLGAYVDITDHKLAEEASRRLAAAVDQAAESIVITDTHGAILYVNPAFEAASGYRSTEVIGQNARILKSGMQSPDFYRELWEVLSGGGVWKGHFINKRQDGTLYEEDATISAVRDSGGRVVNYVAVKHDVTKERRLEQQLFLSQKLEAIGRLAGGVAHDFNNILGVITGYTELIGRQVGADHPAQARLERVLRAADQATELTRQLLAFGRQQVTEPRILDLNGLTSRLKEMLERLIREDIELEIRHDPALGAVKADRVQLEQVVMNLVVNARDAMPQGGRLTIETANADFDEGYADEHPTVRPGRFVMLAVSDTGMGMDSETQQRIFEPFFTTKDLGAGTGLGLATVYGIVKQSGGYVWVYSEPGRGTTFKVYLPRVEAEVEAPAATERVASLGGNETVLLVEDTESLRQLVREMLEAHGYTLLLASHGQEALTVAQHHGGPIHLLLTDVVMPKMGGPELARSLAALRPEMRVLYMSGHTDGAISREGVLEEGTALIEKPFTTDRVVRAVRRALDGAKGGLDGTAGRPLR